MTAKARALVQGMPGWDNAREEGVKARKSLAAVIADFVSYASAQGSNNAQTYFKTLTNLAYRFAGFAQPPAGGRDALAIRNLNRLEWAEELLADWLDEAMDGRNYRDVYKSLKERGESLFHGPQRNQGPNLHVAQGGAK